MSEVSDLRYFISLHQLPLFPRMRKKRIKNGMLQLSFEPLLLGVKIDCQNSCIKFLHEIWDKDLFHLQEQVYVLFADSSNEIIFWHCMGTGSFNSCIVDLRLLVSIALNCLANKIILAHNHTNNNNTPSDEDKILTTRLMQITDFLGIKLVDHIILCKNGYYSFSEHGELERDCFAL